MAPVSLGTGSPRGEATGMARHIISINISISTIITIQQTDFSRGNGKRSKKGNHSVMVVETDHLEKMR
uniref:Uncharacterized protein n=1 Tax=Anopheles minimus TaxID=112268 RepID=A0A182WPU5_9DIPT